MLIEDQVIDKNIILNKGHHKSNNLCLGEIKKMMNTNLNIGEIHYQSIQKVLNTIIQMNLIIKI